MRAGVAAALVLVLLLTAGAAAAPSRERRPSPVPPTPRPRRKSFGIQELRELATRAGFSGADARIAAAIAMGESGGRPEAIGDNGTSFGLWQIHRPAWPDFADLDLLDPEVNAMAARIVYEKQGWRAWTIYKNNAYKRWI